MAETVRRVPGAILWIGAALALVQAPPAEFDRKEDVAPGITYRERRFYKGTDGPFTMQILEVDPRQPAVNLLPVRAGDRAIGRETVSSMASRFGASAAVNAGYFLTTGPYMGASAGVYLWNGEVVSAGAKRTALMFCQEKNDVERLAMAVVNFAGKVRSNTGRALEITGVNRARGDGDLILYRPRMGEKTLTSDSGVEVQADAGGTVVKLEDGKGNMAIPANGYVLSGAGQSARWLLENARPGARLSINLKLKPVRSRNIAGCKPTDIAGAGPKIVERGQARVVSEGFAHENSRHPRTAVATTTRGTFLFVTLDGRQPTSAGMRLSELAEELVHLGAVEAMNLDGGGSTTMFVNGKVRNSPSDGKERPVSDAILIFSTPDAAALDGLRRILKDTPYAAKVLAEAQRGVGRLARSSRGNGALVN